MSRSPLFYPMHRGDTDAGGAADLQTDIMRFMAILALCLVAIFALVQSIPLIPEAPTQSTATAAPPPTPDITEAAPETPAVAELTVRPEAEPEREVRLMRPKWTSTFVPQRNVTQRETTPEAQPTPQPEAPADPLPEEMAEALGDLPTIAPDEAPLDAIPEEPAEELREEPVVGRSEAPADAILEEATEALQDAPEIVLPEAPEDVLAEEPEDHVKSASAWSLGQIGRHTPNHAKAIADAGVLAKLVAVGSLPSSSEDLRTKCVRALRFVIEKLTDLAALDRTLQERGLPHEVVKFVVHQISKVLPNDPKGRHDFVTSGGLAAVQALEAAAGTQLKEHVDVIKSCYPEEIVQYYSPAYPAQLLEKLEVGA